jgi:signal transduction histidine kinase
METTEHLHEFSMIFNDICDGCCILNKDWEFEFINDAAITYIGKPRESLLHKNIWEILPIYTNTIFHRTCVKAYEENHQQSFELKDKHSNKLMKVHIYPTKIGLVILLKYNPYTKKFIKEANDIERLKIIGEMAAGVTHEIRNPMTTVKGFLQLLAQDKKEERNHNIYHLMIEELNRANDIITEFLDLSKDKPSTSQKTNLNVIIKSFLPLLETKALKENKLIRINLSEISDLYVSRNEIRQLLLNMINNALEAMPVKGNVEISTFNKNDKVYLEIKDQGKGICPSIADKIGTPFVSTKDSGTGLGLAICYSIASRNNATIDFTTSSKGTTFTVCFNT